MRLAFNCRSSTEFMVLRLRPPQTSSWQLLLVALPFAVAIAARASGFDLDSATKEQLLPSDATDSRMFDLGWGKQISFTVDRKYPSYAFRDADLDAWSKRGFHSCKLEHDGWDSIIDESGKQPVRRFSKNLMLYDGSRLVLLVGQYISMAPTVADRRFAGDPDTAKQVGTVMIYGKSKETTNQIIAIEHADCK